MRWRELSETWDHYTEIGHKKGKSRVWFMIDGKLVIRDYNKVKDGHDVHDGERLESKSIAVGRIDDRQKKISIRTPLSPTNSWFYIPEQKLALIVRKLTRAFPDFEIWYFGKGATDIQRMA